MLVDTDAFGTFIRDEGTELGCSKMGLMEESMKQVGQQDGAKLLAINGSVTVSTWMSV